MCTCEDALVYVSGTPSIDDVMSYNLLTTLDIQIIEQKIGSKFVTYFIFDICAVVINMLCIRIKYTRQVRIINCLSTTTLSEFEVINNVVH